MAPEGKPVIFAAAGFAVLSIILAVVVGGAAASWIGWAGLIPFGLTLVFFRDPPRMPPDRRGIVVSPADGKIIEIIDLHERGQGDREGKKVSIFMSVVNVHVNRIPVGGVIETLRYNRGKFLTAFHPEASLENERQFIAIKSPFGTVGCVQVAGWLARRIVCHLREGQQVQTGERFGVIRFGSRVDLYLPSNCELCAVRGQKVRAGETILGVFHEKK